MLICLSLILVVSGQAQAASAGETLYVWAKNGLNLREQASASSAILSKLNYGAAVTILAPEAEVKYDFPLFPSSGKANTGVLLNGKWLKVKAGEQEGFVFDKLLLGYAPYLSRDGGKDWYDISAYLEMAFALGKLKETRKKLSDNEEAIIQHYGKASSGVTLQATQHKIESIVGGIIFTDPNMSLEQALVFFYGDFPTNFRR